MQMKSFRNGLVTATALSSAFWANAAWADCVSQAPVNPNQVVCDNPGTGGWNGSATNGIVVTVNAGSNVTTNVGGPAVISTGANSAVINAAGNFNNSWAPNFGINAGSNTAAAISVGGGSIVTNASNAEIQGTVTFGNATGAAVNVLNNNYSASGSTNLIGYIFGNISAQGNFTFNNGGLVDSAVTQTGAGTVAINNGMDGGWVSAAVGGYSYQNGVLWGIGGNAVTTAGNTTLVNHGGGNIMGGLIRGNVTLGTGATGSSSLTNGSQAGGNATIMGSVTMADRNNTITNDGTITGNVTMNGTGSNVFNAGSSGSAGDNGLRLPGSQIDGSGNPTGTVTGTLTGLAANAANNTLNLNGTGSSTLQVGTTILNFGVVNKNDSGTWTIKNTLDGNPGSLTTVNINDGVLSVDNASFLGSSATTVHNNSGGSGFGGLIFNGTAAGTFAGNIDGTGNATVTGANATTFTGTNTQTGWLYVYSGGVLNANSNGALSANSDLYLGNGTLNVNATNTINNLIDWGGTNYIHIAGGASLSVAGGHFGDDGGHIDGLGDLIKYSTGTLDLFSADQMAPGSLIVNNGTVNDHNGALGSSVAVRVNSTATTTGVLNILNSETVGSLAGTGANAQVNISSGATLAVGGLNTSTGFAGKIAGSGALVKDGTGILTLTGANTYTGGTTVNDGALMGFVGTGASITGDYTLNNGAFLTFNQLLPASGPQSGTYAGNVTGGASAYMQFGGNSSTTVTLTGNNTGFAGTTTFGFGSSTIGHGGTVAIGSASNIGTGTLQFYDGVLRNTATMTLANAVSLQTTGGGGTFNTDAGTTLTLTGGVAGGGALLKIGTGTLVLDGISSYTGGTTVSAGTLQGRAGVGIQGDVVNNATVMLWGNLNTYTGSMSGTGNVVIFNHAPDPNTIMGFISGTNTYSGSTTIDAGAELDGFDPTSLSPNSAFIVNGILTQGSSVHANTIGSLAGSGLVVANGTLNIGNDNTSTNFSGQFGTGGFWGSSSVNVTKIGTGTQTLSGTGSVLTGALTVNGGTLSLTGTLTDASTVVNTGATLSVDGTLTSPTVTVASGGRLVGGVGTTPGNIVGAVTNNGTVSPGHSPGIIAISGSYTQGSSGTYAAEVLANGTSTVTAGVNFDRIAVSGAPGTATLAGTLAVTRNNLLYVAGTNYDIITTTGGITGNFATVTGNVISPFLTLSNAAANGGGVVGNNYRLVVVRSAYNTVATNPNQVAVANGLTGMIGSGGAASTVTQIDNMTAAQAQALFDSASPEPYGAYATALQDQGELFTRQVAQRIADNRGEDGKTGLWINAYGSWANGKDRGDYRVGNDHSTTGGAIGVDMSNGSLRFGVAGGYSEDKVTYLGGNSNGKSKSWQVGGYAGYGADKLHVDAQLAYISSDITALKSVAAGSGLTLIQGTAAASTNASLFKGVLTVGYDMGGEKFTFEPYAGIDFASGHVNGFTETGMGVLNLTVGEIKADRTDLVVGARVAAPMGAVSFYANAAYRYDLNDNPGSVTAYFNGVAAAPFTVSTIGSGRSVVEADAGISAKVGSTASLFVGYQGSFRNDLDSHGVNGGVRINF